MAEKEIVNLSTAETVDDNILLPCYVPGSTEPAQKVTGKQIKDNLRPQKGKDYWTDSDKQEIIDEIDDELVQHVAEAQDAAVLAAQNASVTAEYAQDAQTAAEDARQNAESLDADGIHAAIALKGDNLEYDENEEKLYMTSNGERIGDGITIVVSGGGGGGGVSNNAVLTLKNTTGWIYKTVSLGASCPISVTWSSIEDGMETGTGVLKVTVNGTVKHTVQVEQGEIPMDVGPWLVAGSCAVKVNVTDVYGNSRTLNFNITAVALSLTSDFDNTVPYTGAFNYVYTPTGAATKTVHFELDGAEIATASVTTSGRQQTQAIPAQAHGSHTLEVYFTAVIDGEEVPSNRLYYDLICLESGNTTPVIASDFNSKTAEQFDSIVIPYRVYDPASMTATITLTAPDMADKSLTVDRTVQTWTYRADTAGAQELTITCGKTVKTISLTITESQIDVEAETDSLALYLSSYGRSNNEDNPAQWVSGNVAATFENYNFVSDGWITDAEGITALRTTGDARLTIPLKVFEKDFRSTGKTIELDFATRDILNYDAVILSCWSGERGLQLTAQRALLKSESSAISTQYKEDEHVRLSFVVQKRSAYRLLQVYINGILSGVIQYPDGDDFSQSEPVNITVGSNDCTIDLYTIRVYDNDLTRFQILDNWIADTQLASVKNERWKHNNVFDDYGQIVIGQLPQDLPYLIINAETLPQFKGNKITVSGEYVDPVDSKRSFTFTGAEADVQGTSSAEYARKNYKIKFKGGFTNNGVTLPNYQLRTDSVPTNVFTFKADVASSEGANNVELVKLYNDTCPYKTPPQREDATIRQGIDGYPIVIFQNNGADTVFIGKYNFNNDKATPEVFGFTADDESWEIRNNTSDRVIWKNDDFSGTDWLNDFEGRHPDGNTDPTNLAALASWIKSTDTTGLGDDEKATRLAKFKSELKDWMDVDSTLFYYLFTELFLMVDSRAKNAFPTRYDGGVWCWLPYDMDTAIGINNEGALTFGYQLEDTDKTSTGADVYNGQNSVLWNNVREAFKDELMEMYQELRSNNTISYADTEARFENHQSKWPEAIFNEDAYYKYLEPLFVDKNGSYLGMLQGSKAEQRKWWLYNRFRYMDSKYNAGDALKDVITLRGYAKSDITITPYADIYATIKFGSYLVQARALRGSSYTLECPLDNVNDTETYIYSASQLADVGDLSGYMVGYADFTNGTKLQSLKLGDASANYSNTNLIELYLGNNALLKTLDVRNCPNLGIGSNEEGTVQSDVDISGCTNVEHIYFDGTSIKALALPNGGVIKTLHLPGTITNLTIRNHTAITDFVLPDYSNITTLRLENVSTAVPVKDIFNAIPANSRVRLIGFDWTLDSAQAVLELYDYLDTMRGLDENGNNVDTAQMQGVIHVDNLTGAQLSEMKRRYPSITIDYKHIESKLYFYDDTGSTLLYTATCHDGSDGVYAGDTPVKEETNEYAYTFVGWSKTVGGNVDEDALKNVTLDRSVYAVFAATEKHAVQFYGDGVLLHTQYIVHGEDAYDPVAAGEIDTPIKEGDENTVYIFDGWDVDLTNVTEDRIVNAIYVVGYAVRFYNEGALVNTQYVQHGLAAVDPVVAGYIDTPTKESTAQYAYTYEGWDASFDNITESRSINAVYSATVRTYTVRFYNENVLLQTVTVPYGGSATYTGDEPGKGEDYAFTGWSPNPTNVTADMDCYAQFKSTALYSVKLIDRTISGAYTNDRVTSVGIYAFYSCSSLSTADFPAVTSVGDRAFYSCSSLSTADFPAVTSVGIYAFGSCSSLTTANFPAATSVGSNAFSGCSKLTTADFPAVTSVDGNAFGGCSELTTANFPAATSVDGNAFYGCSKLTTADFPAVTSVGSYAFGNCSSLTTADFPAATSVDRYAFNSCYNLTALILRNTTGVCTLSSTNAFNNTPIKSGTGYIYVPRALLSDTDSTKDYRRATNWSAFEAQFRALEDYTVDGTTTGELDPTKI